MIVIGIPSRNEAATIGGVVQAAVKGLREVGALGEAVFINCDNGSNDGTPAVFSAATGPVRHECLRSGDGSLVGKGTNVLAIMRHAGSLEADALILLDADVRSVEPGWVGSMLEAVDQVEPAMATPVYRRNRFEGNTTNHITAPLMRACFGAHVQQPIAGDFALNRSFLKVALEWPIPDSGQLYGIDITLTAQAARHQIPIVEVPLGRKLHNPGFPKILYGSQQVIDSLFHVIVQQGHLSSSPRPTSGRASTDGQAQFPDAVLVANAVGKVRRYIDRHAEGLPQLFPIARDLPWASWGFRVDAAAWAEVLADAVQAVAVGRLAVARDHLVALYFCRVMTYWDEIADLSPETVDLALDRQSEMICTALADRQIAFDAPGPATTFEAGFWAEERP